MFCRVCEYGDAWCNRRGLGLGVCAQCWTWVNFRSSAFDFDQGFPNCE